MTPICIVLLSIYVFVGLLTWVYRSYLGDEFWQVSLGTGVVWPIVITIAVVRGSYEAIMQALD